MRQIEEGAIIPRGISYTRIRNTRGLVLAFYLRLVHHHGQRNRCFALYITRLSDMHWLRTRISSKTWAWEDYQEMTKSYGQGGRVV